jgi:hypothetical protein
MPGMRSLRRLVRGLRPDHNPLRRRSDRAEAAIVAGLLAALLAGAPAAAITAGQWVCAAGVRAEHAQQAGRHQVTAVLLETAPGVGAAVPGLAPRVQVQARWTAPDGTARTGQITVTGGMAAGSSVQVWTDASGRLQDPPLRHGTVVVLAVVTAIWVFVLVGLLLLGTWRVARRSLDRRRLAAWESDWRVTGPRWTSRR